MDTMINEKSACVNIYIDLQNEFVYFSRREAAALPGGSSGRGSPGKMPPPAVRKVRKEGGNGERGDTEAVSGGIAIYILGIT